MIQIGQVTFEDITTYSQSDKKRDKRIYQACVCGLKINVSNRNHFEKMTFKVDALGVNSAFVNPDITFESACRSAVVLTRKKLIEICQKLEI